jgi:3-phenylpropionate/trans-cinnamate dioxygenase ferredoxin subunit
VSSDPTTQDAPGFVAVCALADLVDGQPRKVEVAGVAVALVLTEGQVYAINDICSHGQVSLSEGEVEGCALECWLHGSQFDLRTGRPLSLPATDPVPVYPVQIDDGTVLVAVQEQ